MFSNKLEFVIDVSLENIIRYRNEFNNANYPEFPIIEERYEYEHLAKPAIVVLIITILGMFISSVIGISTAIPILITSSLFLFFSNDREKILAKVDWGVLFFFGGMFIVIDAVVSMNFDLVPGCDSQKGRKLLFDSTCATG